MKIKSRVLWLITLLCLATTVVLWFVVAKSEVEYTQVEATVVSTDTRYIVNKSTGSRTPIYEVIVKYRGDQYELENVHGLAAYPPGRTVEAYMANGRLYANAEGVKTSTPLAAVYFVFLFGTLGMVAVSAIAMTRERAG